MEREGGEKTLHDISQPVNCHDSAVGVRPTLNGLQSSDGTGASLPQIVEIMSDRITADTIRIGVCKRDHDNSPVLD